MVYYLSVLRSTWGTRVGAMTLVAFEVYIWCFELRYNMVERFAIKHFCGGFPEGKLTTWLNGETENLYSFWVVRWMY